jgi:hypothetical protein
MAIRISRKGAEQGFGACHGSEELGNEKLLWHANMPNVRIAAGISHL